MIDITPEGLAEIQKTFAALVPTVQNRVVRGLAQAAFDAAETQVDTHTQTGALLASLRLRSDGETGWIIDHDLQHAPYAPFVHWGTRAHEIRPRHKKVLRWPSGQGEKTSFAFARFVHHPGYEGDPWLVKAADAAIRQFDRIVHQLTL